MCPMDLLYTKDHEWVKMEGNGLARVGITDYAQQELGDIVFIELPNEGDVKNIGEGLAVVESVKAASDIYVPLSGTVVEVNKELEQRPELINEDPYGQGWVAIIQLSDPTEEDQLMKAEEYSAYIGEA
jgi:glycine cleavage system H protein